MTDKAGNALTLINSGVLPTDTLIINRGDDGGAPDVSGNPRRVSLATLFAVPLIAALTINLNSAAAPAGETGTVLNLLNANATVTRLQVTSAAAASFVSLRRANTSIAAPSAITTDDQIGAFNFGGHDGVGYSSGQASYAGYAEALWSATSHPTYLALKTTPVGSTTLTERFRVNSSGQMLGGDGAAATPTFAFTSAPNTGWYITSASPRFVEEGVDVFRVNSTSTTGITLSSTFPLSWGSSGVSTADVFLYRDATANTLALRNLTNPQAFRVYNTFTDASNYERGVFDWTTTANTLTIGSAIAGTGTPRDVTIAAAGSATKISFSTNGNIRANISSSGFLFNSDNANDIGASGATRPRSLYWGTQALAPDGSSSVPSYSFATQPSTGLYYASSGINISIAGTPDVRISTADVRIKSTHMLGFSSGDPAAAVADTILTRKAAAVLQLGAADAAAAVAQGLSVQSVVAGTTDIAGANFTIKGSQGTGTGIGGSIIFQTAPASTTGSTQNALVTGLEINSIGQVLVTGSSSSLPPFAFSTDTDTGFYSGGANVLGITVGSTTRLQLSTLGGVLRDTSYLGWGSTGISTPDLFLQRDAAGTLAQRNATTAQAHYVYNTWTDASNYERGVFDWTTTANFLTIGTQAAGTGTSRTLSLRSATSIITLEDGAGSFNRVRFGGSTTSFPALKRNAATLQARLADDSAFATMNVEAMVANAAVIAMNATAIPAGGTAGSGLKVSSTANFGVFFGSGAPTLSAAKGSIYLRSDGSGTGDRSYINTDGATAWTNLVTAA